MNEPTLLTHLKNKDNVAYQHLYATYYGMIERHVKRNNGSSADAEDIFQETVLVLLHNVPKEEFLSTSSVKTYVFAVASHLWHKHLRNTKRFTQEAIIEDISLAEWERREEQKLQRNLIRRVFRRLTIYNASSPVPWLLLHPTSVLS